MESSENALLKNTSRRNCENLKLIGANASCKPQEMYFVLEEPMSVPQIVIFHQGIQGLLQNKVQP